VNGTNKKEQKKLEEERLRHLLIIYYSKWMASNISINFTWDRRGWICEYQKWFSIQ